ncbi:hypothetical protein CYMTET_51143 [Cymbomonas tetramitiformis]|uniref:Uncharacterized protein n=1 Tax=Cymbomonas tetramitiformis TaxID=36881 RepID=A0AAE0EU12_9CHLO|nr:hypothetical protein CYMTET_51143 [Cymbomonas tetramitiformis]
MRSGESVSTNILELLKVLSPEKANKWAKWAEQLNAEDVDNPGDLYGLNENDFNNLHISACLKHILRKERDKKSFLGETRNSVAQCAPQVLLVDSDESEQVEESKQKTPAALIGGIRRWFKLIGSPLELLVPADHYPAYSEHWIESRREDGHDLHEGMLFLYEVEMINSSLLLGVFTALFVEGVHEEMIEDFRSNRIDKLNFYVVLFGILSMCNAFFHTIVSYVMLRLILPVSTSNVYLFFKQKSMVNWMIFANVQVCCMLYSCFLFLSFLLINCVGGFFSVGALIVLSSCSISLFGLIYFAGLNFNLAINTGLFGSDPVFPFEHVVKATSDELDNKLTVCALHNISKFQKPVPASILYADMQNERKGTHAMNNKPDIKKQEVRRMPMTILRRSEDRKNTRNQATRSATPQSPVYEEQQRQFQFQQQVQLQQENERFAQIQQQRLQQLSILLQQQQMPQQKILLRQGQ